MVPPSPTDLARRHLWPPYTSPERHESHQPLVIVEAEGAWLVADDGRRYLDGISSWWTCTLGHRHPRLVAALAAQAARLDHVSAGGAIHPTIASLAAELCAVAPAGLERVFFSDDGSTAVEVAVKIAFQYWQQNGRPERRRYLALSSAYHGDTMGAVSLAGADPGSFFTVFAPLMFDVVRPPAPDLEDGDDWDAVAEAIEARLAKDGDTIAGVVVEPLLQGAGGMRTYAPAILRRIREAATRADTFVIADEVFTGYGRTGTMWACDQAGVVPDLLCTAKGFTAGMLPMAATLATGRIYDGFRAGPDGTSRALMHGHSFCGHPIGAAIAREILAIYRDEQIVAGVAPRAARIAAMLAEVAKLPGVLRTRQLGIVGAVDLGDGGYGGEMGPRFTDATLRHGLYLRPLGDTAYVCPPLNIPLADLDTLCEGFVAAVAETVR
ncbi:MAG TPA: adenosylmethionine--8-amino-7-oxononanoate transaminase [Kofleriaceae bacterium]|nr:adenosylmethionine--8-amino-7-oxononanoate transaminase [Kofleriaceae bacterium]